VSLGTKAAHAETTEVKP